MAHLVITVCITLLLVLLFMFAYKIGLKVMSTFFIEIMSVVYINVNQLLLLLLSFIAIVTENVFK